MEQYSIIRVKKHVCNSANSKKVMVILEVEVIKPGHEVGEKLGSPVTIGSDGQVCMCIVQSNRYIKSPY